jgi:hypothetical protein
MPKGINIKTADAIDALHAASGVIAVAAQRLGVTREALSRFVHKHPTVKAAYDQARETSLDVAEAGLMQFTRGQIAGQTTRERLDAIKFYLRTVGRLRGYGDRLDVNALLNIDLDGLTDDQVLRIASGENPAEVLR